MKKMRLHIVLAAFLIVLAIGFAAQKFLYLQQVREPLEKQFAMIAGVESVNLVDENAEKELVVTTGEVTRLDETYQQILKSAQSILGEEFDSIQLIDKRNPHLEDALHASHFAIEEGIATGYFTKMAQVVAEVMSEQNIADYRLAVDSKYVYLQIAEKDDYLLSVFPRSVVQNPVFS